jgi:hypothetical protein
VQQNNVYYPAVNRDFKQAPLARRTIYRPPGNALPLRDRGMIIIQFEAEFIARNGQQEFGGQ